MYFILRMIVILIYKIVYNVKFEGTENIPKEGGKIYASNHRSYADPVLITLPVRRRFCYMAKEELFKNPFFSLLIRAFGACPVKRGSGDMDVIEQFVKRLKKGKNLAIFPEGTRSKDGKVGRGKSGVALIAAKTNADIIPVGIIFEGKLKFRSKVVVRYGKPIKSEDIKITNEHSLKEMRELREKIMGAIRGLVEN